MEAETHWFNVTVLTVKDRLGELEEQLWQWGAVSVTVVDAADSPIYEPAPDELPIWAQIMVTGLFGAEGQIESIKKDLIAKKFIDTRVVRIEDRVWEREWLHRFQPMRFGDGLWVCPSGFESPEGTVIKMDPGLAFGTGTHATTRLCLEYLDGLVVDGYSVLDYGCGSGVLGIGAALKGASSVLAVDNDPQALNATLDNAERNDVKVKVTMPDISIEPVDLVFANILAGPLVALSSTLLAATRPDGYLVLSGIMSSQKEWLLETYEEGGELIDLVELDGWVRLVWRC